MTAILAVAEALPAVTVIVAIPLERAVTSPLSPMAAMAASLLDQATSALDYGIAPSVEDRGGQLRVSPIAARFTVAGVAVMLRAACLTLTVAVALLFPAVAVTCAVPFERAVTSPLSPTVATDESPLDHVNTIPLMMLSPSKAVAVSCTLSPTAASVSDTGTDGDAVYRRRYRYVRTGR